MLNKNDKLIQVRLYTPHKCDFFYQREDGTCYVHRKLEEQGFYEMNKTEEGWTIGEKIS